MKKDFAQKMQEAVKDAQEARIEEASDVLAEKSFFSKNSDRSASDDLHKNSDSEPFSLAKNEEKSYLDEGSQGLKSAGFLSGFKKKYLSQQKRPSSFFSFTLGTSFMSGLSEKFSRIRPSFLIFAAAILGFGSGFVGASHLQSSRVVKMEKEIVSLNTKLRSQDPSQGVAQLGSPTAPSGLSLFSSPAEEHWYADLSRANHGLEARAHCSSSEGRVIMQGTDKAACLLWVPK